MTSQRQISEALWSDSTLQGLVHDTLPRARYGLSIRLHTMLNQTFDKQIDNVILPLGWYRTRFAVKGKFLEHCLESMQQAPALVGKFLIHASRISNRQSILTNGLALSGGSATWTKRFYLTPRVHLAKNVSSALCFIESYLTGDPISRPNWELAKTFSHWDLYRIKVGSEQYFDDVEMDRQGFWTEVAIPPTQIKRIPQFWI